MELKEIIYLAKIKAIEIEVEAMRTANIERVLSKGPVAYTSLSFFKQYEKLNKLIADMEKEKEDNLLFTSNMQENRFTHSDGVEN